MSYQVRILHVIGHMDFGGAETMIMEWYRHINRELVQFDFVENTLNKAAFDDEIENLGGRIFHCPHYNVVNHIQYVSWWKHFFEIHQNEYGIIHGHLGSTAAIYLSIAKKNGLYAIAHSHNTSEINLRQLVYSIYSWPTRYVADYFLGCSKEALISRYGNRVAANRRKSHVIKNAISIEKFAFDPEVRKRIRKSYDIDNKIVIGHVGRFSKQKNHSFIIDVFSQVLEIQNNALLLLIGDGELKSDIIKRIKEYGIEDKVIFAGQQYDVSKFYNAMDYFMFPSLYEGLGIVLIEAQCSGLPCIISDTIPKECVMDESLINYLSLQESATVWANRIVSVESPERKYAYKKVINRGYAIEVIASKIQNFYLYQYHRIIKNDGQD